MEYALRANKKCIKCLIMKLFIISDLSDIHTKRWVSALAGRGIEIFLFGINKPDEEFYKKLKQVTVFSVDVFSKCNILLGPVV